MSLTAEQKKLRLQGLGGSEIAAVAGLNPFATALDVWRSKVEGYEIETTAAMERGIFLEAGVADWYAHRTGRELIECGTLVHPTFARVMCTPDRLALKDGIDVSIKVPGPRAQLHWGQPGTDEVPDMYLIQVQWEMINTEEKYGIRHSDVVAPIDNDLGIYPVLADSELQGNLVELGHRFWRDYIETGTPPPIDGTASCTRWMKERFPSASSPMLSATPEAEELMAQLYATRTDKKNWEEREAALINQLKDLCGNAQGMSGAGWRFTWKNSAGSLKTDWKAVATEVSASDDLIQKHSRITEGSRRFVPFWETK